jgi:hypothetical protein
MIRRRRRVREIAFSFDSFLDVVANVVGIIIRLILVVWVGARSYHTLQFQNEQSKPVSAVRTEPEIPLPEDPLERELEVRRRELAQAQARLLEQMRELQQEEEQQQQAEHELNALASRRQDLLQERAGLDGTLAEREASGRRVALSLEELRERGHRLAGQIRAISELPPAQKTLRYRTPVSRPVHSEELLFECKEGRVTFIDIGALLQEVKRNFEDKGQQLKARWQVADVAGPVGAFRLRYVIERERGRFDAFASSVAPEANATYRYGLSEWQLEPVAPVRGETADAALADGSEFRHIVDGLDPQQTVVTLWVYPDSFALYRRVRDYLYERDLVVAGRPLPDGVPIASSRRGTVSRGQ